MFDDLERDSYLFDDDKPSRRSSGSSSGNGYGNQDFKFSELSLARKILLFTNLTLWIGLIGFLLWTIIRIFI